MNQRLFSLFFCPGCRRASFHHYRPGYRKMWEICDRCGEKQAVPMMYAGPVRILREVWRCNRMYANRRTLREKFRNFCEARFSRNVVQ